MFALYFIVLISLTSGFAKIAPDFIHPCSDTNSECVKQAAQYAIPGFVKGLPHLGIPCLDPFDVENLDLPLSGISLYIKSGKVYGLSSCLIDDIDLNLEKRYLDMDFHCNLTLKGHYAAEGKLFTFPIKGEGPAKITLTNLRIQPHVNLKYIKNKHDVTHIIPKDYTYTFDYGKKVTFDIKDIFKGNKELSDAILEFMNKEWKTVAEECGKPMVDYAVGLGINYTSIFFSKVPIEEITGVKLKA